MTGKTMVTIREHKIPSADSKPYIAVEGPDRCLWFCESGAAKIGRLDPDRGAFTEFALANKAATPIGITTGSDGDRKSTRLNSSHAITSRMPSSA